MNSQEQQVEFVSLIEHDDYEILTTFPYTIRRKDNRREVKESIHKSTGYICVYLNGKFYQKHRLIAKQFIENDDPEHKTEIDHINHDKTDYNISNLRWVSNSTNQRNKSSNRGVQYQFITDLPDDAIVIDYYIVANERRNFLDQQYYYARVDNEDVFYTRITNDGLYKIMHINTNKNNTQFICMIDTNNKQVHVCIKKFKHIYDIKI